MKLESNPLGNFGQVILWRCCGIIEETNWVTGGEPTILDIIDVMGRAEREFLPSMVIERDVKTEILLRLCEKYQ